VSDVSRDIFYKAHRPLVVAAFLEPRQIAELPPGGALRVDVAQPVASVVACERIDMERHLALMSRSLERHRNNARTRRMKRGGRRATSRLLLERAQHARDGAGQPQPAVELGLRRAASLRVSA
jgi:hypothetical protein